MEKHTVHWFRKGLRLHDNPSLHEGLKNSTSFRCIYIIDPWFAGSSNVDTNIWRFLLGCLEDLDQSLRKLSSRLFVLRGQPVDVLPKFFKEWGTNCLTFEQDPEPFGKVRDSNIIEMCKELHIEVIQISSHTLYNLETIIERNGGRPPFTYNQFQRIINLIGAPMAPHSTITLEIIGSSTSSINDDHDYKFGVPTLSELRFDVTSLRPAVWIGGETTALVQLERHLKHKVRLAIFDKPKVESQSLLTTKTGLTPYLRFGCLSARLFYQQLTG